MKIAIVGTKGIPNAYGGFEAFAENISVRLAAKGFAVTVFQPHHTAAQLEPFGSVARLGVKVFGLLPQNLQRVQYNLSTLHNLKRQNFDVALCCGHSPSIFLPFFSRRFRHHLVVNMDGLEWKREKWGFFARSMLKLSEMLAVKFCNTLVADSQAIQLYLINQYNKKSVYIPYGANDDEGGLDNVFLEKHSLRPMEYGLLIARIEPENRIEQALKAFNALNKKLVVVGGLETPYGKAIMKRFSGFKNVVLPVECITNPHSIPSVNTVGCITMGIPWAEQTLRCSTPWPLGVWWLPAIMSITARLLTTADFSLRVRKIYWRG